MTAPDHSRPWSDGRTWKEPDPRSLVVIPAREDLGAKEGARVGADPRQKGRSDEVSSERGGLL